jgi:hypothetical protein
MKQKHSLKTLLICLLISLALHIFVVFKTKTPGEPISDVTHHQQPDAGRLNDLDDNKTNIWVSSGVVPCDSYDGIGIQFNALTGIVSHVAPDSPAYKAGIKNGDELITPLWNMELFFAQKIDLVIVRDGKHITLPIIVDRICHE